MKNSVGVLGPAGTFTEEAASKSFPGAKIVYYDTVGAVFDAAGKEVETGIVPIENSIEGSVNTTMDNLIEHDVSIKKEIILDINLCLLTFPETTEEDVKIIISHPHAIAQCANYLKQNFPHAAIKRYESTAAAVKELKELDLTDVAAIGPTVTAKIYDLKILARNIQDMPSQTRFIAFTRDTTVQEGKKTSIIFILKDRPGALYQVLKDFADGGINLTKIESRPSKKKLGDYTFFVDFEGGVKEERIERILGKVREKTSLLKVLGSYDTARY